MFNYYCTDTSAAIAGGRLHAAWRKRLERQRFFFFRIAFRLLFFVLQQAFIIFYLFSANTTHIHSRSVEYCTHSHTGDRGPDEIRTYFNLHSINSTMYRKFKRILCTDIIIVVINIIFLPFGFVVVIVLNLIKTYVRYLYHSVSRSRCGVPVCYRGKQYYYYNTTKRVPLTLVAY